jgi:hypothetical protein
MGNFDTETLCGVLRRTYDGEELNPDHLKMLEHAVNGNLNDEGVKWFKETVIEPVMAGTYRKPWFHGIEHLTVDHIGYVHWKGIPVEHYSSPWCWGDEAKKSAQRLARICQAIEARGDEVTGAAVWKEF